MIDEARKRAIEAAAEEDVQRLALQLEGLYALETERRFYLRALWLAASRAAVHGRYVSPDSGTLRRGIRTDPPDPPSARPPATSFLERSNPERDE